MNILITGVAGFIGSHLAEKLLSKKNYIIGIDNFDKFYSIDIKRRNISGFSNDSNFMFYEGDIRNDKLLKEIFKENKIDAIVHLAAKAGVRPSISQPHEYYDVNINGTLNILETMKEFGVKKLVFASSSSVYGNNKKIPFSEDDNVDFPISPYAATKKSGELLCHTYHHLYNFDITCLRFFTVFGPRQRPDLAIHKFTDKILNGESIDVYGDGSTSRDYTYIEDIVDGVTKSISNLYGFNIFNLGESKTITLSAMIAVLEKCIGKKAIKNYLPMQEGDVITTFADITKTKNILGYSPVWEFDVGIREFVKWKTILNASEC